MIILLMLAMMFLLLWVIFSLGTAFYVIGLIVVFILGIVFDGIFMRWMNEYLPTPLDEEGNK